MNPGVIERGLLGITRHTVLASMALELFQEPVMKERITKDAVIALMIRKFQDLGELLGRNNG